ncbi:hypothetical protein K456DRAFT_1146083 [Colletotrichum gloeosporioides 23]|nr:hypothetical protein K456DRAFT_1146083 [Colletotrichum gloeosporioides 23]
MFPTTSAETQLYRAVEPTTEPPRPQASRRQQWPETQKCRAPLRGWPPPYRRRCKYHRRWERCKTPNRRPCKPAKTHPFLVGNWSRRGNRGHGDNKSRSETHGARVKLVESY